MRKIHSISTSLFLVILVSSLYFLVPSQVSAQLSACTAAGAQNPKNPVTVSNVSDAGVEKYGIHTVCVGFFNTLRYNEDAGITVTLGDAPSLPTQIVQAPTETKSLTNKASESDVVKKSETAAQKSQLFGFDESCSTFECKWLGAVQRFKPIENAAADLDKGIQSAYDHANTVTAQYLGVLRAHSEKLESTTAFGILHNDSNPDVVFQGYTAYLWPSATISDNLKLLNSFSDDYLSLTTDTGYKKWVEGPDNLSAYKAISDKISVLKAYYQSLDTSGDKYTKLMAAQQQIADAREHFSRVFNQTNSDHLADVSRVIPIACDQWFGKSKTSVVQLVAQDRLDDKSSVPTTTNLVSIVCQSNLTVTSGLGFTLIPDKVPAFEPVDTTGTQGLGYSSQSRVKPLYAFHINTSLHEYESGLGLHGQVGAAFTSSASDSSALEYLFGLSISIAHRTLFFSPSYHLAQRTTYQSGFGPGTSNTLKGSLTSLPTQQVWKSGFGFTVSFPISGK